MIKSALFLSLLSVLAVLFFLVCLLAAIPQEAGSPIVIGTSMPIHSTFLNEDRSFQIHLPEDYAYSQNRYPVIYLLDGPTHFTNAPGLAQSWGNRERSRR